MSYKHFSSIDRAKLAVLLKTAVSREKIGRILKKNRVSIWRELKKNSFRKRYLPSKANRKAKRRKVHRKRKIENYPWLKKYILSHLKKYWSPEQIAGRLRKEFKIVICHETIYQYIIRNKRLKKYLRCQKGKYRRRHGAKAREKQREYAKKRWIGERPDLINQRQRLGDWEGDIILGKERTKRILTHVERKSGYLLADYLAQVSAEIISEKTADRFKKIPKSKRQSITYDNGTEFSFHEITERKTKTTIYFANAYHSYERGANENTNRLLRQFFPKKSSFAMITERDVKRAERLLNHRPRKRFQVPFC